MVLRLGPCTRLVAIPTTRSRMRMSAQPRERSARQDEAGPWEGLVWRERPRVAAARIPVAFQDSCPADSFAAKRHSRHTAAVNREEGKVCPRRTLRKERQVREPECAA